MEEAKYSVEIRGKTFGPFGRRRLQEFVDKGQIEPATYLLNKQGHKVPASAIPGLVFSDAPGKVAAVDPDPDLVKRFTSAPKPYPQPVAVTPVPLRYPTDLADPPARSMVSAALEHVAESPPPESPQQVAPVEIVPLENPVSVPSVGAPTAADPVADDKTVMQSVDYSELEAKFSRAEAARQGAPDEAVSAASPPPVAAGAPQADAGTRVCPYCEETIKAAAKKCRFCMEWLPDLDASVDASASAEVGHSPKQPAAVSGPANPAGPPPAGAPVPTVSAEQRPRVAPPLAAPAPASTPTAAPAPAPAPAHTPAPAPASRQARGASRYTCPSCRATSPIIQYVVDQQRIHCNACGFWTEATFKSPPPAKVLATVPCPTCKAPPRYIANEQTYYCDVCGAYPGQVPTGRGPSAAATKADNALGWKFWTGITTTVVVGSLLFLFNTNAFSECSKFAKSGSSATSSDKYSDEVSVRSGVRTATQDNAKQIIHVNAGIENLEISKSQEKGALVIRFSYNDKLASGGERWIVNRSHPKGIPLKFLVRMFDTNRQYLKHFTTKENFLPPVSYSETTDTSAVLRLSRHGNKLVYPVNQRDLSYVKGVEFGFTSMGL